MGYIKSNPPGGLLQGGLLLAIKVVVAVIGFRYILSHIGFLYIYRLRLGKA